MSTRFDALLADYIKTAIISFTHGSPQDERNAEKLSAAVLAEHERAVNDLSEDLHSAARCGQSGPKACPGCVIDGLREELDRANVEVVELRYERNILGYTRIILDRAAEYENLSPVDKPILRREAANLAQRIVDEIGHAVTDEPALGPELREEIARLTAQLAEVRTGKSRVGDGIDRRGWTDAQWLEEARSIFCDAFGGAGDLLNGHVSAMWKQLTTAKHEQEQLVAIVAATLRQLGTVLGVNIGEEIRKHVSAGPGLSGTGTLATPTESSPAPSNVDNMQRELAILNDFLHARCMHPGYEYATTTGPRKAFDNYKLPPDKRDGWVPNTHSGNETAWERFDYHEERYWRRPWTPDVSAEAGQ